MPTDSELLRQYADHGDEAAFAELMRRLFANRYPDGTARNPLFRLQPESWLQSTLEGDLSRIDDCLGGDVVTGCRP